jgi:hypothetical protein
MKNEEKESLQINAGANQPFLSQHFLPLRRYAENL